MWGMTLNLMSSGNRKKFYFMIRDFLFTEPEIRTETLLTVADHIPRALSRTAQLATKSSTHGYRMNASYQVEHAPEHSFIALFQRLCNNSLALQLSRQLPANARLFSVGIRVRGPYLAPCHQIFLGHYRHCKSRMLCDRGDEALPYHGYGYQCVS